MAGVRGRPFNLNIASTVDDIGAQPEQLVRELRGSNISAAWPCF
jgi:hypothetical protein